MPKMKCPDCGSRRFYVKDPDDQYNISEFELQEGIIVYLEEETDPSPLAVDDETETFCDQCAWHDKFRTLTN